MGVVGGGKGRDEALEPDSHGTEKPKKKGPHQRNENEKANQIHVNLGVPAQYLHSYMRP